ncbi:uncharacterized protein JCM6883_000486 [Sporobolomyces salmoneus]|uniref:uncharacterized protein n=1 Tax=Sporobolomyces salmoneus TaxID=183962 RepID=UPI00317BF0A2
MLRLGKILVSPSTGSTLVRHASTSTTTSRSTRQLLQHLDQLLHEHSVLDETWRSRIQQAITDLDRRRLANVSIVGDRSSGVQKLSSAILDDPLANENPQDVTVALESRSVSPTTSEATTLQFGEQVENPVELSTLPARWLQENNTTITEIVHGDVPLESSFTTLHLSDAVLVLVSSTSLLSSRSAQTLLLNLHTKPNLLVCVNTRDASPEAATSILETLQHQLDTLFPSTSTAESQPRVMAVSTEQALEALSALSPTEVALEGDSSTSSQPSFEDFQRGYLASQLPRLKSLLSSILSSHSTSSAVPTPLQQQTALYVLSSALSRAAFSAATLQDTLTSARNSLEALSQQTSESSRRLLASPSFGVDSKTGMFPLPDQELLESRQAIQEVFDKRLQFYKLPFNKIDDISSELSLVISQTYLTRFEKHLLYSTGLFSSHSTELSKSLHSTLEKPPFKENELLHSSILENEISKSLHPSPNSPTYIPPTSLSTPISLRRSQLLSSPLSTLHRTARKALTSSLTLSVASLLSAVGLNLVHAVELANCAGVGVLGSTLAVWLFQGRWERGKKKFWREFERVGGGVSEDLGDEKKLLLDYKVPELYEHFVDHMLLAFASSTMHQNRSRLVAQPSSF